MKEKAEQKGKRQQSKRRKMKCIWSERDVEMMIRKRKGEEKIRFIETKKEDREFMNMNVEKWRERR